MISSSARTQWNSPAIRPGPQLIGEDEIIVRDVGKFPRKTAWWWMVHGHHICDHRFNSITVEDLEREVDPESRCDPWFRRMLLWRSVPEELWRLLDYGRENWKMSQPGLCPSEFGERG
jgi:hypothetical protein